MSDERNKLIYQNQKSKNTSDEELVIKSFKENKGLYGRVRLSIYIYKKYKINLNYRKIGRIMNKFSLKCLVRQKKRKKEKKDIKCKIYRSCAKRL
ncbi:transposase [Mycoplasma sp. 6243]|uniref:transposase n=1 Tax=Mycoplasma sp. 6243 TaxID=3440865 RepID=UPI003EBB1A19